MARLTVVSHKPCWPAAQSPTGYATDGGFPMQMAALSELFSETRLVVPCALPADRPGGSPLVGHQLAVVPLSVPTGRDFTRKLGLVKWLWQNAPVLWREVRAADAIHAPVPGDVGTLGMLLAFVLRKPLYVRHCGNWARRSTLAERFWRWFMETMGGGLNVMLATGGGNVTPSASNPAVRWIFSTSLTEAELATYRKLRPAPAAQPRLVIICRQERGKGTELVLQSLQLLRDEFPALTLDVAGSGDALNEFKQQAAALGLAERVRFHGQLDHTGVMNLLQSADLFCFPTRSEGFPKVVLEALACGLPVITTRVSVLPQLLGQGAGVLLDSATPETLAAAIRDCLNAPERYRAMSAQALATAQQYSLERWRATIGEWLRAAWGAHLLRAPQSYGD